MLLEHQLDRRRNVDEAQGSGEKSLNGLVVGRAENSWVGAPGNSSFPR
jgi:hypothetical protein